MLNQLNFPRTVFYLKIVLCVTVKHSTVHGVLAEERAGQGRRASAFPASLSAGKLAFLTGETLFVCKSNLASFTMLRHLKVSVSLKRSCVKRQRLVIPAKFYGGECAMFNMGGKALLTSELFSRKTKYLRRYYDCMTRVGGNTCLFRRKQLPRPG